MVQKFFVDIIFVSLEIRPIVVRNDPLLSKGKTLFKFCLHCIKQLFVTPPLDLIH